jgi:hypothetical protein
MRPLKYDPTITLGTLIHIGAILLAAFGIYLKVELRDAKQDQRLDNQEAVISELKDMAKKQIESTQKLSETVVRIEERIKVSYARGNQ